MITESNTILLEMFTFNAIGLISISKKGAIIDEGLQAESTVTACTTTVVKATEILEC